MSRHLWWAASFWAVLALLAMVPMSGAPFADATSNDASAISARSPIRVTTYEIGTGTFTGNSYDLTLQQDLAPDYFVLLRGAAGDNTANGNVAPNSNYVRIDRDPFGNLSAGSGAGNQLRLARDASANSWQGHVTVVESLSDQATAGFTLRGVAEVYFDDPNGTALPGTGPTSRTASVSNWSSISSVALYGGYQGGGVATEADNTRDHINAWGRVFPSGSNVVNVVRNAPNTNPGGYLNGDATFTVYAVEWGAEWDIQRVTVTGSNGGNGVDSAGEYDTAAIGSVIRANTFVTASGWSTDNGLGDGFEAVVFTLGNGVIQNASETTVAVGAEYVQSRSTEVYVHEHPRLVVDYRFGADGSIPVGGLTGTRAVDAKTAAEGYSGGAVGVTSGYRMSVLSNTSNSTGNTYPRPIVWARHTGDTTVEWGRSRSGQPGAMWLQSVDFGEIWQAP